MDIKAAIEKSNTLSELARNIFGKENYTNREKCKLILSKENIDWKEWLKIKKEKPKKYCLYCGKEITGKRKFCNHSCAASYNNLGIIRNEIGYNGAPIENFKEKKEKNEYCLNCGKPLNNKRNTFCSKDCEIEYKYKNNIQKWKNGTLSGCDKNGEISNFVKKYILIKHNFSCQKCGFNTPNPFTNESILQIHHIDGNCRNNNEENLELLCPNCHALTENFGRRNEKSGRTNRYKK